MQGNFQPGPITRITDTVIRDINGEEVLRISTTKMTVRLPDGSVETHTSHDNIITVDGSTWNFAMLAAKIYLAVCPLCRRPPYTFPFSKRPNHGLLRLSRAKTCVCGALCCAAHRKLCLDGRWRCLRCARRYSLGIALKSIFFSRS